MVKIAPSILSADQADLKWALEAAYKGGADYIHVDVMDLHFVPNLTIGPSVCADLAKHAEIPLDIHLMVDDPDAFTGLLYSELKKRVIGKAPKFEGLIEYPAEALKKIARNIEMNDLALALKGAGEEIFKKLLDSMTKEKGAELVQQMGNLGTVRRDEIAAARERVTDALSKGPKVNPVKYVVAHQEGSIHLDRTLNYIRSLDYGPGVALNPVTPVGTIEHVLHLCDIVLIMSVNPGFGGQEFIPYVLDKARRLKKMIEEKHLKTVIEIDGGIKPDNAGYAARAGCDILVAGAAVFNDRATPGENIKAIRDACAQAV
jgi:pentose-5-phosphate-3-epimerase